MIAPSELLSVPGSSRVRRDLSWNVRNESAQEVHPRGQADSTGSSSTRRRSVSSVLDFRSRTTPGSYLDSSSQGVNQLYPTPPTQSSGPGPQRPFPSISSHGDTATVRGQDHRASTEATDGKVCLHTHHHHYWIISDSAQLQQAIPRLRSSRERVPLRTADENSRLDGHMDSWPSEDEIEALAGSQRPPSCDTNHRYFIEG